MEKHVDTRQQIDYDSPVNFSRQCLERDLSPLLTYHNVAHTFDDVLPAAVRLAHLSDLPQSEIKLLTVAAAFHDIGYTIRNEAHEEAGVEIACRVLPRFGFRPEHLDAIRGMILATRLPQSPRTLLEQILADADLDLLGREDFWERNEALRTELRNLGQPLNRREWYETQLNFLESHRYFTAAARTLREETKRRHIAELKQQLAAMGSLEQDGR